MPQERSGRRCDPMPNITLYHWAEVANRVGGIPTNQQLYDGVGEVIQQQGKFSPFCFRIFFLPGFVELF